MGRFLSLMLAMCALFFEGFAQRQVQGIARPDLNRARRTFDQENYVQTRDFHLRTFSFG